MSEMDDTSTEKQTECGFKAEAAGKRSLEWGEQPAGCCAVERPARPDAKPC